MIYVLVEIANMVDSGVGEGEAHLTVTASAGTYGAVRKEECHLGLEERGSSLEPVVAFRTGLSRSLAALEGLS